MAQYRNINVRSPFYVQHPTTELLTSLSIRIWNGDAVTDKPTAYNYILEKEQTGGQSTFEIAELLRDFCSQTSDRASGAVWVETTLDDNVNTPTVVIYLASEGYSLYSEGVQHNGNSFESDFVALPEESSNVYRQTTHGSFPNFIPVYVQPQPTETSITGFADIVDGSASIGGSGGTLFLTELSVGDTISIEGNSYEIASIASNTALTLTSPIGGGSTNISTPITLLTSSSSWRWRCITNGTNGAYTIFASQTESDKMFQYVVANPGCDYIEFDFNGTIRRVYVDTFESTKYSCAILLSNVDRPVQVQYANKFGTRSYMTFSLKHIEEVSVSSSTFNRNVMDVGGLSNGSGLHASRRNITGSKQSFTINTDWINEYHVKQLEELIMSEYVWASIPNVGGGNLQPVNLKTQNLVKKNHLNDKLIQYTFKIETASEYMNTVR